MKITDLSLRDKILQTVCALIDPNTFLEDKVGAAFFFGQIITDADEMGLDAAVQKLSRYIDHADIPLLVTSDFENGCGSMLKGLTPFPYMMGLGATDSEEIAYNYGKATALEAKSVGANWSFSPVSDLNLNPRNPLVGVRGMTDDPDLACRLLKAVIRGMQDNGLAACAKHFPGDGVDYRDQHIITTNNTLPVSRWKEMHGRVFQELIDDGVYSVMAGHITLPHYQQEKFKNGMYLPATLSHELIDGLLKKEMGFDGVVVTDALNMGGFMGWYDSQRRAEIEAFKAGCDMMLWPTKHFVEDMTQAIENGYISMERLDDAVGRILTMKEKLGLFDKDNHAVKLSAEDRTFVAKAQKETAEHSVTLLRDEAHFFPLSPKKTQKIAVIPVTHHAPALEEGELLCSLLRERGFTVDYWREKGMRKEEQAESYDLILYALFSRPFRPIGFLDFQADPARNISASLKFAADKTAMVSFGSPYHAAQYFERCPTVVNAYSMVSPSVEAFVKAATGDIPFTDFSPVHLKRFEFEA